MYDIWAGIVVEDEEGYHFQYRDEYLDRKESEPVSLTFPLQRKPFSSEVMFPFFDGLIPEGWLLEIAERNWKVDARDRMGLLLKTCQDCIGAVSILPFKEEAENE